MGDTDKIIKIDFSTNDMSVIKYRVLDYNEREEYILMIENGNILCVHNSDFSDVVLVNILLGDNRVYSNLTQVEGINQNNEDGLYEFINSDEIVMNNYKYIDTSNSIRIRYRSVIYIQMIMKK